MKKLITAVVITLTALTISAQTADTLLFEDFQVDKTAQWAAIPHGQDAGWVNYDQDGLTPYDYDNKHRNWYHELYFYKPVDSVAGTTNYCATSMSFLEKFKSGNRNWLILPPLHISGPDYTLHWKSAPAQLPAFMDGYLVLAANGSNDVNAGVFRDTLFQAASMTDANGNLTSIDASDFVFSAGYLHDPARGELWDDESALHGLLEPHSVSLSAYSGKTLYLAFLHNSDNDYLLALDDILVTNAVSSGVADANDAVFRMTTYPNPVEHRLNILYRLPESAGVNLQLTDMSGRLVMRTPVVQQPAGEQQIDLDLSRLASGSYAVSLHIGERVLTKMFLKK